MSEIVVPKLIGLGNVCCCGKSYLADKMFRWLKAHGAPVELVDADAFHPEWFQRKARHGIPMDDEYRRTWIKQIVSEMDELIADKWYVILACSMLRRWSRNELRTIAGGAVQLAWVDVPVDILKERLAKRDEEGWHFFKANMLPSQLRDAEPPTPDEPKIITVSGRAEHTAATLKTLIDMLHWVKEPFPGPEAV